VGYAALAPEMVLSTPDLSRRATSGNIRFGHFTCNVKRNLCGTCWAVGSRERDVEFS